MKRGPFLLSLVAVAIGWAGPGCSGSEFTGTSGGNEAGDSGEPSGGNSGASSGGTSGSDSGGEPSGGSSGNTNGGTGGSSTGGSSTGGDAGEESGGTGNGGTANGGNGNAGMGGMAGAPGGGTGGGGVSGMAGRAGSGGTMGGASGSGGSAGGGSSGKGGSAGSGGSAGKGGTGGTAGTGGSGGTAGTAGTGGSGGVVNAGCPSNPPAADSNCNVNGYCMYGTHPLASCRQIMDCVGGHWKQTQAACGAPPSCSVSSEPPQVGAPCSNDGFMCRADQNVFCLCTSFCSTVCTAPTWDCFGPPVGCPILLPNHGQPCTGSMNCAYGSCSSNTSTIASCESAVWRLRSGNCPQ